jgi:hypothetical protein
MPTLAACELPSFFLIAIARTTAHTSGGGAAIAINQFLAHLETTVADF